MAVLLLLALVPGVLCGEVGAQRRFTGSLEPTLVMGGMGAQRLILEQREHGAAGSRSLCADASRCFAGTLEVGRRTFLPRGASVRLLLSEKAGDARVLYADVNRDATLDPGESFSLRPTSSGAQSWDVVLRFPTDQLPAGHFAYLFRLMPSEAGSRQRILQIDEDPEVRGQVDVDGRSVLVALPYSLASDGVELRNHYLGMDCDGDGAIDRSPVSSEFAYAQDEDVVFRIGSRYVSVAEADRRQRLLVLWEHPPEDYQRVELRRGATLPAIAFRGSDGIARRSLVTGRSYTLLFFWGLGCGAWPSDVPVLNEALRRFGGAGFSVVAVSDAADEEVIRRRVKETGATWTQVAAADGRALYLKRFRVFASPTVVLVDGQGRIVSRNVEGEWPLRGSGLLTTLEQLLPSDDQDR